VTINEERKAKRKKRLSNLTIIWFTGLYSSWLLFKDIFVFLAAVCGGKITTPQGTIQSPKFPAWYPSNKKCTWTISLPEVCTKEMKLS